MNTGKHDRTVAVRPTVSDRLFRVMADTLPSMIRVSGEDGGSTWFNRSWLAFTGRALEEEVCAGWIESMHPEDRQRVVDAFASALAARMPLRIEYRLRHRNGEYRRVVDDTAPMFDGEAFLGYVSSCADVSDRAPTTEDSIPGGSRFVQAIAEASPHTMYLFDRLEQRNVWANRQIARDMGYTLEQVRDMGPEFFPGLVHPDDSARIPDLLARWETATDGQILEAEYRLKHADGSWRLFLVRDTVFTRTPEGSVKQIVGTAQDITERKRSEEALRESEARLAAVIENSPGVAVQWYDARGRVMLWNKASEEMFGFSAEEAVGKTLDQLIHTPEECAVFVEELARIGRTGESVEPTEFEFHRHSGETGTCISTIFRIPGDREDAWFVCMDVDITERKRAEEAVVAAREEWEQTFNALTDWVSVLDLSGRILRANRAMREQFEPVHGDLIGRDYREVYYGTARPDPEPPEAAVLSGGPAVEVEAMLSALPGNFFVSCFPLRDAAGRQWGVVSVVRDVTRQRKLEEQLRQSQKMQAIGQLAGGVAHDFNNVLTVINGYSDLLLMGMTDPVHPMRRPLTTIRNAGERATLLTRQLLAFSRKQDVEPKVVEINDVARHTTEMLLRLIGENIVLTTILGSSCHRVRIDPTQIEQVILNLALNARDAMPDGGQLTIETQKAEIDEEYCRIYPTCKTGHFAQLTVSDTGCGMTPEVSAHIFEPFFTTKAPGKGTGLGLAIVYGIVEQSGGFLTVYSEVGLGTSFNIFLPAAEVTGDSEHFVDDDRPLEGTETVLLVEDENGVRQFARVALEMHGYTIVEAASGAEAIRLAEEYPGSIDLVVTDIVLPELNGHQVVEALRARRPGLEVLFMSGYTDETVVRHGILDRVEAFLQKPFTPIALARKVREVLDAAER